MRASAVALRAAAQVQSVIVRWSAGTALLGTIVQVITLEIPGHTYQLLRHVHQADTISGEAIAPFVIGGMSCIFHRALLDITLEDGISIRHRSM